MKHFEFPDYFGNNWAAFDECINDLDCVRCQFIYINIEGYIYKAK